MKNKDFENRMAGINFAYEIVKKGGIEELEKEIKRRNITRLPLNVTKAETDHVWHELCENMYNNITTTFLYVLSEKYDTDQETLLEILDEYNKTVKDCTDMDVLGEHYIRMEDYAIELNEKLGIRLDVDRIAACQDHYDETNKNSNYHKVDIERVVDYLERNGYVAAATFLKNKVGD